ncbi:DUF3267 domain-containing protein [Lysinibacillus sp. 54212]|uniref:DUF3267 domain-containing protein n=1 Tax=Lysinibacillus sp. 54212 TaxID=3119829 RepID=UPI002FC8AE93
MHCLRTINVEHEYGTTRLTLLTGITFIIVFCFSYVATSYNYGYPHNDDGFIYFCLVLTIIYPIHKLTHYIALFNYKKALSFRFKIKKRFIPIIQMRLNETIPKNRYIFTLLAPFFFLNSILLGLAFSYPQFSHYFCILLALHCSICLLDILFVKNLWKAPKNAIIEETPKGYEILVPTIMNSSSNLSQR